MREIESTDPYLRKEDFPGACLNPSTLGREQNLTPKARRTCHKSRKKREAETGIGICISITNSRKKKGKAKAKCWFFKINITDKYKA